MKIKFSRHASFQIRERKISKYKIINAIVNPDGIIRQSKQRFRAVKKIIRLGKKYLLVAVCDKIGPDLEVVTVFITSKIRKYEPGRYET